MHVISYRNIREFSQKHADSLEALDNWYKIASQAKWLNLVDIQLIFPKTEAVGNFTVFNIKGSHPVHRRRTAVPADDPNSTDKYRLIVSIDYEKQLIYLKYVLTHAEYDKEKWKNDPYF